MATDWSRRTSSVPDHYKQFGRAYLALEARCALLQEYYEANEACAKGNFSLQHLDRLDAARAALADQQGRVR